MTKKILAIATCFALTGCFSDMPSGSQQIEYISASQASHPIPNGTYRVCEEDLRTSQSECENVAISRNGADYTFNPQNRQPLINKVRIRTVVASTDSDRGVYLLEQGPNLAAVREERHSDGRREIIIYESRCARLEDTDREDLIEQGILYSTSNRLTCRVRPDADLGLLLPMMVYTAIKTRSLTIR